MLSHRDFGNIVQDIEDKYENVEVFQLRKLERLSIKIRKAGLDIKLLRNCKIFNFIPKFLNFNLHIQMKLIQNINAKDYCVVR